MDATRRWSNKSSYLENVTGLKIVEEQERINNDSNSFVVATTIFKIEGRQAARPDNTLHTCYDAFIYYKEQAPLEGQPMESKNSVIQDDNFDVVIP